jgi:hypothetical protein
MDRPAHSAQGVRAAAPHLFQRPRMLQSTRMVFPSTQALPIRTPDLTVRSDPNWTAAGALGAIAGGLAVVRATVPHLIGVAPAMEYASLAIVCALAIAAAVAPFWRHEVAVLSGVRAVRVRHGTGFLRFERFVSFRSIRAVRLTIHERQAGTVREARIELLGASLRQPPIACPRSLFARQHAVGMALTIGVRIEQIHADTSVFQRHRRNVN